MNLTSSIKLLFLIFLVSAETLAFGYIGPGMGGGVIAATVGIIIAIFAALFGLIWFPLKKLIKKRKEKKELEKKKFD